MSTYLYDSGPIEARAYASFQGIGGSMDVVQNGVFGSGAAVHIMVTRTYAFLIHF